MEPKETDIRALIPQRAPIVMVDRLLRAADDEAETCFAVGSGNIFLDDQGCLAETGVLEHIAQSASAFAGWRALQAGAARPPLGFIGEVKKFHCHRRPCVGDELHTVVIIQTEFDGILVVSAEVQANGQPVADTQMKVSIHPDE